MRRGARTFRSALVALAALVALQGLAWGVGWTRDFRVEDCTWSSKGTQNPHFPLVPGWQLVLEGEEEDDEGETVLIRSENTVLRERQRIGFRTENGNRVNVTTRVYEEREFEDGELVEVSRNFLAICRQTGDVFYFGEDVDDYEDGEIVGHEGAWRAGVDGAQPGILFPGRFLLGAKYYQELAPDVALDRARNVAMGLDLQTPAGDFADCVGVEDSNALEPDAGPDPKVYCPGVGIVMDEVLVLVEMQRLPK